MPQIKENTHKVNKRRVLEFQEKFLTASKFPGLRRTPEHVKPENAVPVFKHSIYLHFIRAKYLFVATLEKMSGPVKFRNEFATLVLLKAFWETTATVGYAILNFEEAVSKSDYEKIFDLAIRLGLGGKKYPTKKMLDKVGRKPDEYTIPNVLTMMEKIDKDWNIQFKKSGIRTISGFKELYDEFIAEAGHPTYTGIQLAGRWTKDRETLTPNINRNWEYKDEKMLYNYLALSGTIFFYYWDRFQEKYN